MKTQQSRYVDVLGSRMHYLEAGEGDPIVLLHGNPTSSHLWRNVIPHLAPLGRVIAPDLIGMGKSDKPDIDYRFFDHVRYLDAFFEALDLEPMTLVLHDWGSALGFHYARRHPDRVRGIAFMEAIIRTGDWSMFPPKFRAVFGAFRTPGTGWLTVMALNLFVKRVLPETVARTMSKEEIAKYAEPFPTIASRKPLLAWPREIPIAGRPADVHAAVNEYVDWLQQTDLPKVLLHAKPGALITAGSVRWCQGHLSNLDTVDVGRGIHFIQEDNPDGIGRGVANWYLERVASRTAAQSEPAAAQPEPVVQPEPTGAQATG